MINKYPLGNVVNTQVSGSYATIGSAFPATVVPIGLTDGTNTVGMRAISISKNFAGNLTSGATSDIWTPAAGKRFRILLLAFSSGVATEMKFYDGATFLFALHITINDRVVLPLPFNGYLSAAANNVLKAKQDSGGVVGCDIWVLGTEE